MSFIEENRLGRPTLPLLLAPLPDAPRPTPPLAEEESVGNLLRSSVNAFRESLLSLLTALEVDEDPFTLTSSAILSIS